MAPANTIFAFGIANPAMLFWLAAVAAPVLIHLWSRRRYREAPWAAMEYLLAAFRRRARRVYLEQFLLLAIRILVIVAVVLAAAEPYLRPTVGALPLGGRTHRVLVLDGSYSMCYRPSDRTRFELAKDLARQIVQQSRQGDAFTLVLMASPPRAVVGTPALEPALILPEIDALQPMHTSIDLPATVALVRRLIEAPQRELPHITAHEVYFLTDLCGQGWLPRLAPDAMQQFRRQTAALAQQARIKLVDLGQDSADNLAVTDLRVQQPIVVPGQTAQVEVSLRNFGRRAYLGQKVALLVNGQLVGQQAIDVAPGQTATLVFSHRFDLPGEHIVEARADGDALDVDNRRFLVVPVRNRLRVLVIEGRPSADPFGGAADYLAAALAPGGNTSLPLAVEVAPEAALSERELFGYDCLIVCDVAQLSPAEAQRLDAYLSFGGSVILFMGENVQTERYNMVLGAEAPAPSQRSTNGDGKGPPRLLPARLGPVLSAPQGRLDPLGFRHPIIQPFQGRQTALLTVPVMKYVKLHLLEGSQAQVVLAAPGGDPLIVEEPIQRGRVVVVATSADKSWTLLPLWPSFVPLVHEMVRYCVAGQQTGRSLLVGEPLGGTLPIAAADATIEVKTPAGRTQPVAGRSATDRVHWHFADTLQSGVYTVDVGSPLQRSQSFAVNVDTAESDLTHIGLQQLQAEVWPGVQLEYLATWDGQPSPSAVASAATGWRLHLMLLYALVCLLLAETLFAWRFGYPN